MKRMRLAHLLAVVTVLPGNRWKVSAIKHLRFQFNFPLVSKSNHTALKHEAMGI